MPTAPQRHSLKHSKGKPAPKKRLSSCKRGYNYKWQKAREKFLALNPVCKECKSKGELVAAAVVDHVIPHKGDAKIFWDFSNWQPLCKRCHDRKTVRQDGGFGNAIKTA